MKLSVCIAVWGCLALTPVLLGQGPTRMLTTRQVEGPTHPFARQMTGHPFRATPLNLPENFALPQAGNFQAQAFPRTHSMYVSSFAARSPSVPTMVHEGVGGLTKTGMSRELSRPWQDTFTPFATGLNTWQPTPFTPSRFPVDQPLESARPLPPIGQRVSNGPSWINIDLSKEPPTPRDGFRTPLPK